MHADVRRPNGNAQAAQLKNKIDPPFIKRNELCGVLSISKSIFAENVPPSEHGRPPIDLYSAYRIHKSVTVGYVLPDSLRYT